jgi:hypothetical protein
MSQSVGNIKMLSKFGYKTLELEFSDGNKKPVDQVIQICSLERDRLDSAIKYFREHVPTPTRIERRYFNSLREERKKLQHEIKKVRKAERVRKDKELHEMLNVMTKDELKDWRVLSHKLYNAERNLDSIQEGLTNLNYSKFVALRDRLRKETEDLQLNVNLYKVTMKEIQDIMTRNYYRDLEEVNEHKASTATIIRETFSKEIEDDDLI